MLSVGKKLQTPQLDGCKIFHTEKHSLGWGQFSFEKTEPAEINSRAVYLFPPLLSEPPRYQKLASAFTESIGELFCVIKLDLCPEVPFKEMGS